MFVTNTDRQPFPALDYHLPFADRTFPFAWCYDFVTWRDTFTV